MTRPRQLRSFGVAMAAILAAGVVMGHLQPAIAADEVEASASSLETPIHPRNAAPEAPSGGADQGAAAALGEGAFIDNSFVQLGVNPEGHLNVPGGPPSSGGRTTVGLRWMLTNNDAISPGCLCEGWGAADDVSNVAGWASGAEGIAANLEVVEFASSPTSALSIVNIKNGAGEPVLRVRHLYEPVLDNPFLYQALVTITNVSDEPVEALYRRVMDWDVEPTAFDEWVTLKGNPADEPWLAGMTNDGFAHPSPLEPRTDLGLTGEAVDYPFPNPTIDHGALFDLDFGTVQPQNLVAFTIYYGVAGNEADALAALDKVGARVYSLGQPALGRETGLPNTFMFGFGRPLSCGQEDFGRNEVRSDMANRAGLTDVAVHYDARTLVDPRTGNWELSAPEVAKAVLRQAEEAFDRYKALNFLVPDAIDIEITCDMFFRIPGLGDVPPETAGLVEGESKMKLRTSEIEKAFRRTVLDWNPGDPFVPPVGFWQELINHEAFHAVQIATTGEIDRGLDFANGDRTRIESSAVTAQELDPDWDDVASDYAGRAGGLLRDRTPADLRDKSAIDHEVEGFGAPYNAGLIFQYWAERFEPIADPDLEKRLAVFLNRLISAPFDRQLSYRVALGQDPFDALREFFIAALVRDFPNVANEQPQYLFLDEVRNRNGGAGGQDLPPLNIAADFQKDLAAGPVVFPNQELQDGQGAVYLVDLPAGTDQVEVSLDHVGIAPATPVRLAFVPLDLELDGDPFRVTVRRDLMTDGPSPGFTKSVPVPVFGKERLAIVVVASEEDARYALRVELANRGPIQILSPTTGDPLRIQEGRQASVDLVVTPSINGVVPPGLGPQHFLVHIGGRVTTVQAAAFNTDRYTLSVLVEPGLAIGLHDVRVTFGGFDLVDDGLVVTSAAQPRPREQAATGSMGTLLPGATDTVTATVSAGADDASFGLGWLGSDVDLTLRAPSGRVITESTVASDVVVDHGADFVTITISDPEAGAWQLEAFGADLPPAGEPVTYSVSEPNVPIRSDLVVANDGGAGTPIAVSLAIGSPAGGVPDATVTAVVTDPNGIERTYPLLDRGGPNDTIAYDGTYAALVWSTPAAGTYRIRVDASGLDATGEPWARVEEAELNLGPKTDTDGDGIADAAEEILGLDPNDPADSAADVDGDGLTWADEVAASTSPYLVDTDSGGEIDATEVASGRDPLAAGDDVRLPRLIFGGKLDDGRLVHLQVDTRDGTGVVVVDRIDASGRVRLGSFTPSGNVVTDGPLPLGTYYYDAYVELPGVARSGTLRIGPFDVADDAKDPWGAIVLNDGAWQTTDREVTVRLVDMTEPITSMRIALSEAALAAAPWVPFVESTTIELAAQLGDQIVYAQLRDAAGRESLVLTDVIELTLLDTTAPTSAAGPLPAVTTNAATAVPYTASDDGSGVFIVELWQRYRADPGAPWGTWRQVRSGTQSPLAADLTSDGEYEFYTVAVDQTGNREAAPPVADTQTVLDRVAPTSSVGSIPATTSGTTLAVPYTATDGLSGVSLVELWSRFQATTAAPWSAWALGPTGTSSPLTFTFAQGGGYYEFYSIAIDGAGNRETPPATADATTERLAGDSVPPTVPANLSATAVAWNRINLGWTASTDNVEVIRYEISRDGALIAVVRGGVTTFIDWSVAQQTSYSYTVKAFDEAGNASGASAPAPATTPAFTPSSDSAPPSVPTNVAATVFNSNSFYPAVYVVWTPSTDNVEVTSYTVLRNGTPLATVDALNDPELVAEAFVDRSVNFNSTYTYTVQAHDAAGNSSALSAGESEAIGTCTACNTTYRPNADIAKNGFSAKTGSTLYTQVRETAPDGDTTYIQGPYAKAGFATLGVGFLAGTPTSLQVQWNAKRVFQSGTSGSVTVQVELYDGNLLLGRGLARTLGSAYTTYLETFSSIPATGLTDVRVKINQTAASSKTASRVTWVAVILTTQPPTDSTPPSVPTGLAGVPVSDRQVNLSWSPSFDVNGVHGYAIFRNGIKISGVTIGTTSFRDLGLAPSTTYQYRIVARDGRGNESAQSSPISVTTASAPTPPADTVAPSVPTGLIAQCVTSSRINLSWNPSTDNVGVQGYLVIRSGVQVGTVPVGSTSYYDIGLSSGVAYHYQLRAIDGRGNVSSLSNTNTTGTCSG